jgi:hypothetical protein
MSNQNLAACFQAFIKNMMQSPTKRGEWFLQLMIEKRDNVLAKKYINFFWSWCDLFIKKSYRHTPRCVPFSFLESR